MNNKLGRGSLRLTRRLASAFRAMLAVVAVAAGSTAATGAASLAGSRWLGLLIVIVALALTGALARLLAPNATLLWSAVVLGVGTAYLILTFAVAAADGWRGTVWGVLHFLDARDLSMAGAFISPLVLGGWLASWLRGHAARH